MTYVSLDKWYPELEVEAPGISVPEMDWVLRQALDEFCRETLLWREDLPVITTVADQTTYDLITPDRAVFHKWLEAWYGSQEVLLKSTGWLRDNYTDWRGATTDSGLVYAIMPNKKQVRLVPYPTVVLTDTLLIRAILRVDVDTCSSVPEFFWYHWRQAITDGCLYRLLSQAKAPWKNLKMADYRKDQFMNAIHDAQVEAEHEGSPEIVIAEHPEFGYSD